MDLVKLRGVVDVSRRSEGWMVSSVSFSRNHQLLWALDFDVSCHFLWYQTVFSLNPDIQGQSLAFMYVAWLDKAIANISYRK